jgi:hypothetical protein
LPRERAGGDDAGAGDDQPYIEAPGASGQLGDRAVGGEVEFDDLGGGAVRGAQPLRQGVEPVLAPGHEGEAEPGGGGELFRELGPDAG